MKTYDPFDMEKLENGEESPFENMMRFMTAAIESAKKYSVVLFIPTMGYTQ